jgi:hypothetical protein
MVESSATGTPQNLNNSGGDVSLLDLWLMIVRFRRYCICSFLAVLFLGSLVAWYLPDQFEFITAIEIGSQTIGQEVVSVEETVTVVDKLSTGYIHFLASQYSRNELEGPVDYIVNVTAGEDSQIVRLESTYPIKYQALIVKLHTAVAEVLIQDHNRTVDLIADAAQVLLDGAEQKLGEYTAIGAALKEQLSSINSSLESLSTYALELQKRILLAEKEITKLNFNCKGEGCTTQILMLTNQIGEWRSLLVNIEDEDKISIYSVQATAKARFDNIGNEQDTAMSEIQFHKASILNVKNTRVLGNTTVISARPVGPDRLLIILVSCVIGFLSVFIMALVLDFAARARLKSALKEP